MVYSCIFIETIGIYVMVSFGILLFFLAGDRSILHITLQEYCSCFAFDH